MTAFDFSSYAVTRDQLETAMKRFLVNEDPDFTFSMVHPDGTDNKEVKISMEGSDTIQRFLTQLAIVVVEENSVIFDREIIVETFYGYTRKLTEADGQITLTVNFAPDLFSALMTDPALGLV